MAMVMDLEFSSYSHYIDMAGPTTTGDQGCDWSYWSPMVEWEEHSGGNDDFRSLIDSIMNDQDIIVDDQDIVVHKSNSCDDHVMNEECYNNLSSPECHTLMSTDDESCGGVAMEDCKGLRLVHLLMAAAEAMAGENKCRELARVILVRLKELVSPNVGSNMERLASYFTDALQGLLDGGKCCRGGGYKEEHHRNDVLAAFQLLQDMSPYVKFGHFTANQAILEAVTHDRRVHIVDYDIMEGIQWASLMQALVSRKDGGPPPHLRITALSRAGGGCRSFSTVQETGRRLTWFAASIGQPFSFHQCRLDGAETFKPSFLKLVRGEALIVNCMLHLPHFNYRSPDSIVSFLSGSKTLNPRLVTLVEEEVGPSGNAGYVSRFMDSLQHYSAMCDSLEAGFPMQGRSRELVERVFLGPRIAGSLDRIYRAHSDRDGCSWGQWLAGSGLYPKNISFSNHCQAKLLIGLYNDGYRVEESASNNLVLGWKSRRLLSASIWCSHDNDI